MVDAVDAREARNDTRGKDDLIEARKLGLGRAWPSFRVTPVRSTSRAK